MKRSRAFISGTYAHIQKHKFMTSAGIGIALWMWGLLLGFSMMAAFGFHLWFATAILYVKSKGGDQPIFLRKRLIFHKIKMRHTPHKKRRLRRTAVL